MNLQAFGIDFSEMVPVKMPLNSRNHGLVLKVSENGFLSLNSALLRDLKGKSPDMEVKFYRMPDCKAIVLVNEQEGDHLFRFHRDGRIRHMDFVSELKMKGYQMPAKYVLEWSGENCAGVGFLEEIPELKDLQEVVKNSVSMAFVKAGRKKNV